MRERLATLPAEPYPPANLWTRLEPEIEQRIEPEPELLQVAADLALPLAWPLERRAEFLQRWQAA